MFYPLIVSFCFYNGFAWANYLFRGGEQESAVRSLHLWLIVLVFLTARTFAKRYTPQSMMFAMLPTFLFVNLAFRGWLPGHDSPQQMNEYD